MNPPLTNVAGRYVMDLGVPRVMGYLAVSRAMGDVDLKQATPTPETLNARY